MRKITLREVAWLDDRVTMLIADLLTKVDGPRSTEHPLIHKLASLTEQFSEEVSALLGYEPPK